MKHVLMVLMITALAAGVCAEHETVILKPETKMLKWASPGNSFLGVFLEDIDKESVKELKLEEEYGALVNDVIEKSPAEKAGLRENDVIIRWNDQKVESAAMLKRLVSETPAGREVNLGIIRDGRVNSVRVFLEEHEGFDPGRDARFKIQSGDFHWEGDIEDLGELHLEEIEGLEHLKELKELKHLKELHKFLPGEMGSSFIDEDGNVKVIIKKDLGDLGEDIRKEVFVIKGKGRMGVTLQELTGQLAGYFGLDDKTGVLISSVIDDTPAQKAGIKAGDVILELDGQSVSNTGDVIRLVYDRDEGKMKVKILRDRKEKTIVVDLPEKESPGETFMDKRIKVKVMNPEECKEDGLIKVMVEAGEGEDI